jgi:hypothetical protein
MTMGPATDTSFRVVGPDERPVTGATVEPYHFKTPVAYQSPPPGMLTALRAVTDATGRARLPAMPREGLHTVQVTSEALGIQRLRLAESATEPAERTIRLRPAASVEGRIVASKPEWAAGITLYATTEDAVSDPLERPVTEGGAKVVTRADGSFTIPAIASGKLHLMARTDEALSVRPRLPESLGVRLGQTTHAEIPLEKAVRVSGVIRVKGTGEPVPGASIHVGYGSPRQGDTVVSDAQGQYTTYALAGDVRIQVIYMPDPLVQLGEPWNERHHLPPAVATFDLPAIEVVKGVAIKGRLVDAADHPVADVRVIGHDEIRRRLHNQCCSRRSGSYLQRLCQRSGGAGRRDGRSCGFLVAASIDRAELGQGEQGHRERHCR